MSVEFKTMPTEGNSYPQTRDMHLQFMSYEQAKHATEVIHDIMKRVYVNYAAFLDIADSKMIDLLPQLKAHGDYRFIHKKNYNNARREMDKVRGLMGKYAKESEDLYLDILDEMSDLVKDDVQKLYWSVADVLNKHNVKDSGYKAHLWVVLMLLYTANEVYKDICKMAIEDTGVTVAAKYFRKYDPFAIHRWWCELCTPIMRCNEELFQALRCDKNINMGIDIISAHLIASWSTEKAYGKVLELHPEIAKECEREQLKEAKREAKKKQNSLEA